MTVYRNAEAWQTLPVNGTCADFRLEDELHGGEQAYWVHALADPQLCHDYPSELWSSPAWINNQIAGK